VDETVISRLLNMMFEKIHHPNKKEQEHTHLKFNSSPLKIYWAPKGKERSSPKTIIFFPGVSTHSLSNFGGVNEESLFNLCIFVSGANNQVPKDRVVDPLPNGIFMACKWGWP